MPSAARLLLYSYVQRNMYKMIQRNICKERGIPVALANMEWITSSTSSSFILLRLFSAFRCLHPERHVIRNYVDKYVITALLPVDAAQFGDSKKTRKLWGEGYALGYASGKILKISNFLKYSPRLCPQATPKGK
ncbi:hypothetical protein T12_5003 [Trichinella patagoniensis]|uniref:Uncharacterized protein n=1 Tax=Trichinella patagoniensis TaxID=990121 RepID=A0A0V0Z5B8_9BILA|nr:hypothetical protein T12_5003 [Trichinella patagoniensis]